MSMKAGKVWACKDGLPCSGSLKKYIESMDRIKIYIQIQISVRVPVCIPLIRLDKQPLTSQWCNANTNILRDRMANSAIHPFVLTTSIHNLRALHLPKTPNNAILYRSASLASINVRISKIPLFPYSLPQSPYVKHNPNPPIFTSPKTPEPSTTSA